MISWQPFSFASAAAASVTSRERRTWVTSAAGSPSSNPTLSQSMASSRGARPNRADSISCTVGMTPLLPQSDELGNLLTQSPGLLPLPRSGTAQAREGGEVP